MSSLQTVSPMVNRNASSMSLLFPYHLDNLWVSLIFFYVFQITNIYLKIIMMMLHANLTYSYALYVCNIMLYINFTSAN